jgi:hypothetical protein
MRRHLHYLIVAGLLLGISASVIVLAYRMFGKAEDIEFWMLMDIAFLPIQVLLVGIIVDGLLARRERRQLLHKMNMVIGTFFSELGTRLLGDLTVSLADHAEVVSHLGIGPAWKPADYAAAIAWAASADFRTDAARLDLPALKELLLANRQLLVLLLANPNLMEHERFTDLLWAVSHLMEELAARPQLDALPPTDREHLAGDVKRVYGRLAGEWLRYCRHLQHSYPYIFSIVVRTHPLQEHPSATVI